VAALYKEVFVIESDDERDMGRGSVALFRYVVCGVLWRPGLSNNRKPVSAGHFYRPRPIADRRDFADGESIVVTVAKSAGQPPLDDDPRARLAHKLASLESAPVWLRRKFLKYEAYPRFLYKYRTLDPENDPNSVRYLKDLLLSSRLWLSSPAAFNDPFDMSADLVFDGPKDRWLRRMKAVARTVVPDRTERRRKIREFRSKSSLEIAEAAKDSYRHYVSTMGVCSFAGSAHSILMWSHYADHHSGLCLQFDLARNLPVLILAVKLTYSGSYPVINWANDPKDELKRTLLRKDEAWSYEDERRIVLPEKASTHLPFRSDALSAIILGCRISDRAIAAVREVLRERASRRMSPVKVFQAVQHPKLYALCMRRMRSHEFS
jgi:hypothetical protein